MAKRIFIHVICIGCSVIAAAVNAALPMPNSHGPDDPERYADSRWAASRLLKNLDSSSILRSASDGPLSSPPPPLGKPLLATADSALRIISSLA